MRQGIPGNVCYEICRKNAQRKAQTGRTTLGGEPGREVKLLEQIKIARERKHIGDGSIP